jgi:hypothetical protein
MLFTACNRGNGISSGTGGWPPVSSSPANVSSSLDVVKIKTNGVSIPAGGQDDAIVSLTISQGFHINGNPATFSYLIATELEAGNGFGVVTAGKPVYPAAQKKRFQFAEEPLAVYEDTVDLKLPLRAASKTTKQPLSLAISVRVQACDQEKCYPPGTLNAMIPIEVK